MSKRWGLSTRHTEESCWDSTEEPVSGDIWQKLAAERSGLRPSHTPQAAPLAITEASPQKSSKPPFIKKCTYKIYSPRFCGNGDIESREFARCLEWALNSRSAKGTFCSRDDFENNFPNTVAKEFLRIATEAKQKWKPDLPKPDFMLCELSPNDTPPADIASMRTESGTTFILRQGVYEAIRQFTDYCIGYYPNELEQSFVQAEARTTPTTETQWRAQEATRAQDPTQTGRSH